MSETDAPSFEGPGHRDQVEGALNSVLSSDEFSGADRLKEFLQYVVTEDLAGRGAMLRAKTIAVDVYRRQSGEADAENLVRVDAGRLRRRLDVYYANSGAQARVRIHIDRGGYAPRYTQAAPAETPQEATAPPLPDAHTRAHKTGWRDLSATMRIALVLALLSVPVSALMLGRAYQVAFRDRAVTAVSDEDTVTRADLMVRREILFNEAPERLQALNLVEQGLGMLLPAPDPVRTEAGMILFNRAALLDPTYAGAPAASALAWGVRAALSPPGEGRQIALAQALEFAQAGTRLDATDPLSLAALGMYDFLVQDYAAGKPRFALALRSDPDNPHVRDYFAVSALFAGDLDTVLELSAPENMSRDSLRRGATRNARATALLLAGDPRGAIDILVMAAAVGDPISIINHAVLAASYQADGQMQKARSTKERMTRAWPGVDIRLLLGELFYDPSDAEAILGYLDQIA